MNWKVTETRRCRVSSGQRNKALSFVFLCSCLPVCQMPVSTGFSSGNSGLYRMVRFRICSLPSFTYSSPRSDRCCTMAWPKFEQFGSISLFFRYVLQFMRVFFQIEQFFFSAMETPDVFDLSISQRTPVIVGTVTRGMFHVDVPPPQ